MQTGHKRFSTTGITLSAPTFLRALQLLSVLCATMCCNSTASLEAACAGKDAPLSWCDTAVVAFAVANKALADTTFLEYPRHDGPTSFMVNTSEVAVGLVLQQLCRGTWRPIASFSKKLSPTQNKYITFGRELFGGLSHREALPSFPRRPSIYHFYGLQSPDICFQVLQDKLLSSRGASPRRIFN